MVPDGFVALDRERLADLYGVRLPMAVAGREEAVVEIVRASVRPDSTGRPSVEAPLHDSLQARFVVHTHPPLINGLTCATDGARHAGRLFPDALWIDYCDPGYTLCMNVRREVEVYRDLHGVDPQVLFIGNHGVFVAADEPEQIADLYGDLFSRLEEEYHRAGMLVTNEPAEAPPPEKIARYEERLRFAWDGSRIEITITGFFPPAAGPVTPDHIAYAGASPLRGDPSAEAIDRFYSRHGHDPRIVVFDDAVAGLGESLEAAGLALEVALDAALVVRLAGVYGGISYMDERARRFIEGWEGEAYRREQVQSAARSNPDQEQEEG